MGFGGLFKNNSGPSIQQQTVDQIAEANRQILASQGTANTASIASRPAVAATVQQKVDDAVGANARGNAAAQLGILDFIKTSSQGLRNGKPSVGRLTILGN